MNPFLRDHLRKTEPTGPLSAELWRIHAAIQRLEYECRRARQLREKRRAS
jgi:hypothetical protein